MEVVGGVQAGVLIETLVRQNRGGPTRLNSPARFYKWIALHG